MLKAAVFTIMQQENVFYHIWLDYYLRHFRPEDIYILLHEWDPHQYSRFRMTFDDLVRADQRRIGFNIVPVHNGESFNHAWLLDVMQEQQKELHKTYDVTLLTEADEIVAPDPNGSYGTNLADYIQGEMKEKEIATCWGYEVVHKYDEEPDLDRSKPLLAQRGWWYPSTMYSKPVLCREPQEYTQGFHTCTNVPLARRFRDASLLLIHLHKIDYQICLHRNQDNARRKWKKGENMGSQNRLVSDALLKKWWWLDVDQKTSKSQLVSIPERMKAII